MVFIGRTRYTPMKIQMQILGRERWLYETWKQPTDIAMCKVHHILLLYKARRTLSFLTPSWQRCKMWEGLDFNKINREKRGNNNSNNGLDTEKVNLRFPASYNFVNIFLDLCLYGFLMCSFQKRYKLLLERGSQQCLLFLQ